MRPSTPILALVISACTLALERPADACGGGFYLQTEHPSVVTDHRMIFAVWQGQTTLYDQMVYSGEPAAFAWVLPIADTVTVGLSSNELFNALDGRTRVEVREPYPGCYIPPPCEKEGSSGVRASGGKGGGVTVLDSRIVGPYETVQLRASDPKALSAWLSAHKFGVPPESQAIIEAYVKEQSAFLAMKLVPGAGVSAMRPVRVTSPGASLVLPLRMVAAGAGKTLGVTLWVVSDGRYEPQNFPWFAIQSEDVTWDWSKMASDFATVRAAKGAASNGKAWQVESSVNLANNDLANALESSGSPLPSPDAAAGAKSPEEERREDLRVLFGPRNPQTVRVTRLRADLSQAALRDDLRLQASADQAELTNVVTPSRESGAPTCDVYDEDCKTVGTAPREKAAAKNKALKVSQFPYEQSNAPVAHRIKRWFSCAAAPNVEGWPSALVIVGAIAAWMTRRGRRLLPRGPPT
jgi:hypothetical protein